MAEFKNWSERVKCIPAIYAYPETEDDLKMIIRNVENGPVRVVGSGHSYTNLCETDGTLISLDRMQGIVSVNEEKNELTVKAGTKLYRLGALAHEYGMAQENLGDIDKQSIAGAISTGTHGTGIEFGNLSTQIVGIKFINGKGESVYCSAEEKPDVFKAAQISLGSFGVITELTFKMVESYKLEYYSGKDTVERVLKKLNEINSSTRNFEFYWFPHTKTVQTKFSNISEEEARDNKLGLWMDDFLENTIFGAITAPTKSIKGLSPYVAKLSALVAGNARKVNWSHKVYAVPRNVKFNEMEYNIPMEAYPEVLREIVRTFEKRKFDVHFPIENRFVKGDDIWLSPAYKRDSAYIAFHVYYKKPYKEYFKEMEDICRSYEGRPHWGKYHTLTADTLSQMYPRWEDFNRVRREQDPDGRFMTPYMRELLGE